jgi:NAD(P)-dependent dehydrogenase (short-subunit alcohol dehydrogenase family)
MVRQLASHLDMEKDLLFQKIRSLGSQGRRIVREAWVLDEFGHLDILVNNAAE